MCVVRKAKRLINGFHLGQENSLLTPALSSLLRRERACTYVCVRACMCVCLYGREGERERERARKRERERERERKKGEG